MSDPTVVQRSRLPPSSRHTLQSGIHGSGEHDAGGVHITECEHLGPGPGAVHLKLDAVAEYLHAEYLIVGNGDAAAGADKGGPGAGNDETAGIGADALGNRIAAAAHAANTVVHALAYPHAVTRVAANPFGMGLLFDELALAFYPVAHLPRPAREAAGWGIDYTARIRGGPFDHGFDRFFGISAPLDMPPFVYIEDDHFTAVPTVEKTCLREGPAAADLEAVDVLPGIAARAVDFIKDRAESAKQGHPFFLYLPLNSPHTPIAPTPEWQGASGINPYADFVMQTDAVVGQVMDVVEQQGLARDTLVIFTSDNGCSPAAEPLERIPVRQVLADVQQDTHAAQAFGRGASNGMLIR